MQTTVDYKILYEESLVQIASLTHQIQELKRLIFGSRDERFIPSNNHLSQLSLDIQAEEVAQCKITDAKKIEYTRTTATVAENKEGHPGRMKLPDHLERREIIITPT